MIPEAIVHKLYENVYCFISESSGPFLESAALFYAANSRGRVPFGPIHVETSNLLVNPSGLGGGPLENLGGSEPEGDLLLGVLDGVGTVAHVAADILAKE